MAYSTSLIRAINSILCKDQVKTVNIITVQERITSPTHSDARAHRLTSLRGSYLGEIHELLCELGSCTMQLCFRPKMTSEAISEHLIFLGEHAPRPHSLTCLCMHTYTHTSDILSGKPGYGPVAWLSCFARTRAQYSRRKKGTSSTCAEATCMKSVSFIYDAMFTFYVVSHIHLNNAVGATSS